MNTDQTRLKQARFACTCLIIIAVCATTLSIGLGPTNPATGNGDNGALGFIAVAIVAGIAQWYMRPRK